MSEPHRRVTERGYPCPAPHPNPTEPRQCVYPDGHIVHWDGDREIWLAPNAADDAALAAAEERGYQKAIDALRDEAFRVLQISPKESAVYEHARNFLITFADATAPAPTVHEGG